MKWYDASKYKPKHGSMVFFWDKEEQKQLFFYILSNTEDYKFNPRFPVWSYADDSEEPERINNEMA